MTDYTSITCQVHDHIEIACMYGFEVELKLRAGATRCGRARTTRTGPDRHEYLVISTENGESEIDLGDIRELRALTRNPHFERIEF